MSDAGDAVSDAGDVSGFGPDHLPYGVFTPLAGGAPRVGVRLGDEVLDVSGLRPELATGSLDALLALGPAAWAETRAEVAGRLEELPRLPLDAVTLHLPFAVADYVDFYASEHHATRVGRIFRPDAEPLPVNWRHLPVGYHGRAGTVVVSGTPIARPWGQRLGPDGAVAGPTYGPTQRLDLEAELGFVVGAPSAPGVPVPADRLAQHVFGVVGLNDWSARDVQAWETRPLGPFLGKSFATSVSAWVTPLAALDAAWCDLPGQRPTPPAYLAEPPTRGLAIDVEVEVSGTVVSRPPYAAMYWSPAQMLAHLTANGASLRTGDLLGSGTISGPEAGQEGCLLELDGARPWLADGDEVVLRYRAPSVSGVTLTLGEVRGAVVAGRS